MYQVQTLCNLINSLPVSITVEWILVNCISSSLTLLSWSITKYQPLYFTTSLKKGTTSDLATNSSWVNSLVYILSSGFTVL